MYPFSEFQAPPCLVPWWVSRSIAKNQHLPGTRPGEPVPDSMALNTYDPIAIVFQRTGG